MSDVLARLMRWMETSDIDDAGVVLRDAITEIAGLRARLHEHRIAAQRLAGQGAMLTDAERAAVKWFSGYDHPQNGPVIGKHAAALRSLLERLGCSR